MASTYTTSLGIEKPGTGEQTGTWGSTVNTNFDIFDDAISGYVSVTLAATGSTGSPNDLPVTDGAQANGSHAYVEFVDGGDLGGDAYVQLSPNDAVRLIWIRNSLSGSRDIYLFQGTYDSGRDYLLENGQTALIHFSGGGAGASTAEKVNVNTVSATEGTSVLSTGETGATKFLREDGDDTCSWQLVEGTYVASTGVTGTLKFLRADGDNTSSWQPVEGTSISSTGEPGGTKFLREDGDGTCSWQTVPGGMSNIVEDTTPQLGGDLDCQNYDIINATIVEVTNLKTAGPVRLKSKDYTTGSNNIDVSTYNRFRVNNTGALTLTFINLPSNTDTELGDEWVQEGYIKIRNGASPGTITIAGLTSEEVIGDQTTDGDVDQILTYIFQRNASGTVETTLIWSN